MIRRAEIFLGLVLSLVVATPPGRASETPSPRTVYLDYEARMSLDVRGVWDEEELHRVDVDVDGDGRLDLLLGQSDQESSKSWNAHVYLRRAGSVCHLGAIPVSGSSFWLDRSRGLWVDIYFGYGAFIRSAAIWEYDMRGSEIVGRRKAVFESEEVLDKEAEAAYRHLNEARRQDRRYEGRVEIEVAGVASKSGLRTTWSWLEGSAPAASDEAELIELRESIEPTCQPLAAVAGSSSESY